jgi:hypothetical protein
VLAGAGGSIVTVLAHILGGGPLWPQWVAGGVGLVGLVGAFEARSQALRRISAVLAVAGLLTMVGACAALPSSPSAPNVSLRIVQPAANSVVRTPVLVTVCADGSSVPGAGRLLTVLVDGRQVIEVDADSAAVPLSIGQHTLRVELVTRDHREFAPPVLTDEVVDVVGAGTLASPVGCSR